MDDQNKNLILATALSFAVLMVWFFLFPPEEVTQIEAEQTAATQSEVLAPTDQVNGTTSVTLQADAAEQEAPRVAISTPQLDGSISLKGGRIDQINLTQYRETLDPTSAEVSILRPQGEIDAFYAGFGWIGLTGVSSDALPTENTVWTLANGTDLTPSTPVTLSWDNGAGLTFFLTYSVDEEFMFAVTQRVENASGEVVELRPYSILRRHTEPDELTNAFVVHEGLVRISDGTLGQDSFKDIRNYDFNDQERTQAERVEVAENGWLGYASRYWMATLIPDGGFRSVSKYVETLDVYQLDAVLPIETIAAGDAGETTTRLFVGAKEWDAIAHYQNNPGLFARLFGAQVDPNIEPVERFSDAIDWGWFFFLTKPIFILLHNLNLVINNMGWSIVALTVVIKIIVLPLAYKSYVSMAKMKELQPEMEKLKESAGDDRQKLQQGMMKLYKDNKVNPASGCLPILIQIPIFFSLYKVIFNTIELRQAPWIGWIKDLSVGDPSSILNLFGLLPWGVPAADSIFALASLGILPILLGVSMWLQQKLNPAPTDPSQKIIFAWMPWVFMFMLGTFASGLVLYWITNNTITFIQQYAIMRSHGHRPDLVGNMFGGLRRAKADAKK